MVVLEDDSCISRTHLRVTCEGSRYYLEDLGSRRGTELNRERITPHKKYRLHGDAIIRIGDLKGNAVRIVFHGKGASSPPPSGDWVDIGITYLENLQKPLRVGRGSENDIPLKHPEVSRFHAEIERIGQGEYRIRDRRSTNGTLVNGLSARTPRIVTLSKKNKIQIGPYSLTFDSKGLRQEFSIDACRLDAFDLNRWVPDISFKRLWKTKKLSKLKIQRPLLNEIDITICPREFVALVGGSGAGKSTLMNALSGFVRADKDSHVLVNHDNLYRNFPTYKSVIGYVPQDDIVHRQLTVRSALKYAAKLRLPDDTKKPERDQRIEKVLKQVDMTDHDHKLIRQLSGGQRKRVSIAVELLGEPTLFFLDEPTSGLDPGLEKKIMTILRDQADEGRTIVLVTHATANIEQCDRVAFMADGHLAYYGPPRQAQKFFNTKDFADIYTCLTEMPDGSARVSRAEHSDEPPPGQLWAHKFEGTDDYKTYVQSHTREAKAIFETETVAPQPTTRQASGIRQFLVLTMRCFELIRRDIASLFTLLLVMPLIGALLLIMAHPQDLVGKTADVIGVELQQDISEQRTAQNPNIGDEQFSSSYMLVGVAQKLLFMFALSANLLGIFAAAYEIVKEDAIYRRERMVNLKIPPYLLSKIAVLGLFAFVQCGLLLAVVGIRLEYPAKGIFLPPVAEMYITLLLATLASICIGLFISSLVRSSDTVIYIILVVLFVQIIFAGAIFELPKIAKPISYLTTTRWTLEALGSTINMPDLKEKSISCIELEDKDSDETEHPCLHDQLKLSVDFTFHVDYKHKTVHLLTRWAALLGFALIFGGLTALVQKHKDPVS